MQSVLTPGDKWMPMSTEEIAETTIAHVHKCFPSSRDLECTWWNVVKSGNYLDRPNQKTPVPNYFVARSYTFQDYSDSGMLCAEKVLATTDDIQKYKQEPVPATASASSAATETPAEVKVDVTA
mmetsp:Transcript_1801/g.2888  ORF Transcript_1801/g.2888 Transcript_1801/m.2888 type:complete len:124 (-) Transcript_1801:1101-1472(-)